MSNTISITHGPHHKGTATATAKYQAHVVMDDGTHYMTGLHTMASGMAAEIRHWVCVTYTNVPPGTVTMLTGPSHLLR